MNAHRLRPPPSSLRALRPAFLAALAALGLAGGAASAADAAAPASGARSAGAPAGAPAAASAGPAVDAASRRAAAKTATGAVTEAEAREVMSALERAARRRNLEGLADLLAADVRIEIRTRIEGREHVARHDRSGYLEMLGGGFASLNSLDGYDYAIADLVLRADGHAFVADSRVVETVIFGGRSQLTESRETARLERRGERVLITSVIATTGAQEPATPAAPPVR